MKNASYGFRPVGALVVVTLAVLFSFGCGGEEQTGEGTGKVSNREETSCFADGRYEGAAEGYGGKVGVEILVQGGEIKEVKVVEQSESMPREALEKIPDRVLKKQTAEDVDAVTGATLTSRAILKAVKKALEKAEKK